MWGAYGGIGVTFFAPVFISLFGQFIHRLPITASAFTPEPKLRRFRRKHAERAKNPRCNSTLVVLFRLNPSHRSRSDRTRPPSSDSESEPSSALEAPRDRSAALNANHVLTCKPFERRTPRYELRGLITDDQRHPSLRQVDAAFVDP